VSLTLRAQAQCFLLLCNRYLNFSKSLKIASALCGAFAVFRRDLLTGEHLE